MFTNKGAISHTPCQEYGTCLHCRTPNYPLTQPFPHPPFPSTLDTLFWSLVRSCIFLKNFPSIFFVLYFIQYCLQRRKPQDKLHQPPYICKRAPSFHLSVALENIGLCISLLNGLLHGCFSPPEYRLCDDGHGFLFSLRCPQELKVMPGTVNA